MSNKTNKQRPISEATYLAYSMRIFQLVRRWRRETNPIDDGEYGAPILYAEWLSSLRPKLHRSAWRQYKAASIAIMRAEPEWFWPLTEPENTLRAAKALDKQTQESCEKISQKTSATRAKKVSETELAALKNHFSSHRSVLSKPLLSYFYCNCIIGLRPVEFANATVTWDPEKDSLELIVVNAKYDEDRAHGPRRTIIFNQPTAFLVNSALAFFQFVDSKVGHLGPELRRQEWERVLGKMQDAIGYANRMIWPGKKKHFTLYSARHVAAAFLKKHYLPEEVAALMGHATDESAYRNYARPSRKSGSKALKETVGNLPTPLPAGVRRIRKKLKRFIPTNGIKFKP